MVAISDYFTDSQAQLNESQKKLTELWKESQEQLMESQKKLADTWTQSIPKGATQVSSSETLDKTLSFQRELVNSVINAQQVAARLAIETQKQLWDDYFQTTQKMGQQTKKAS